MEIKSNKARIILIGCGPHARRVYLPALRRIQNIELVLVIDLENQETVVRKALVDYPETKLWLIKPFLEIMPSDFSCRLSDFVNEKEITGVIVATEPLVHKAYAIWALQNGLNILMDKPISARADAISKISSAEGILEDYLDMLENYRKLQFEKETIFMVN